MNNFIQTCLPENLHGNIVEVEAAALWRGDRRCILIEELDFGRCVEQDKVRIQISVQMWYRSDAFSLRQSDNKYIYSPFSWCENCSSLFFFYLPYFP